MTVLIYHFNGSTTGQTMDDRKDTFMGLHPIEQTLVGFGVDLLSIAFLAFYTFVLELLRVLFHACFFGWLTH